MSLTSSEAKSPECLTPSAHDTGRKQSAKVATFNLISTMIGGGSLSLPYAISQCGLILGFAMIFFAAFASILSFDFLISSSRRTGSMTYQQIGYFAFHSSKFSIFLTLLIFLLIWIASTAYCILIGDLIKPIVCYALNINTDNCGRESLRRYVIIICIFCISPFCYMRNIRALKYTSVLSMISICILACIITYTTLIHISDNHHTIYYMDNQSNSLKFVLKDINVKLLPTSFQDVLYVFPVFGLSFMCHFNIPQVHSELKRPTRKRIRMVLIAVTIACTVLYCIIAFFGYFYSLQYTCGNILLNYNQDNVLISIARLCLGFVLLFTFPLFIMPARALVHNLLNIMCNCSSMNLHRMNEVRARLETTNSSVNEKRVSKPIVITSKIISGLKVNGSGFNSLKAPILNSAFISNIVNVGGNDGVNDEEISMKMVLGNEQKVNVVGDGERVHELSSDSSDSETVVTLERNDKGFSLVGAAVGQQTNDDMNGSFVLKKRKRREHPILSINNGNSEQKVNFLGNVFFSFVFFLYFVFSIFF